MSYGTSSGALRFVKCFFSYCAEEAFDIILMTHPSSVGALPRVCHPVPSDFDPRKDAGRVSNEEQVFLQPFSTETKNKADDEKKLVGEYTVIFIYQNNIHYNVY
jgi:hypothetical protein